MLKNKITSLVPHTCYGCGWKIPAFTKCARVRPIGPGEGFFHYICHGCWHFSLDRVSLSFLRYREELLDIMKDMGVDTSFDCREELADNFYTHPQIDAIFQKLRSAK